MASLINCKLVDAVTVEGLTATAVDIATQYLYIVPDNDNPVELVSTEYGGTGGYAKYTVAAADFTDYTHLLPAEQREGIATGSGAGGLGITLEDTGTPYTVGNKVKITVDIKDDFSLTSDHTITIDIGGAAKEDNTRDAILALRTDFANQIRGGTITTFNTSTGASTDVTYTGAEGLVDVTFTPATGITDPKGNNFAATSTPEPDASNVNYGNDYSQEDDIIYIKGDFVIDQWTKLGTINVSMNSTAVATAIANKKIPDSSEPRPEGYYGFVFRKAGDAFNSFNQPSAISMQTTIAGFSTFSNSLYRLVPVGGAAMVNVPEEITDGNTGVGSIDPEYLYSYWTNAVDASVNNTQSYTTKQSANKTYLATSWSRDLWFKYPTQEEMDSWDLSPAEQSFFHTTYDLNSGAYNLYNDLTLSGFLLAAAPASSEVHSITSIELVDSSWEESNISNDTLLPSVEDFGGAGDNQDDYAYIIPQGGSIDGSQKIRIKGDPGAKFTLEIQKVDVNDFTTGKSLGDAVFGRNVLDWNEQLTPEGAIDNGTTDILTIPSDGQIEINWPETPSFAGSNIFNYYLTVYSESDTQIQQSAFDSRFGADIFHEQQAQSFSGGLNWTLGPGNTAKIRFRQIPSSSVTLSLAEGGGFGDPEVTRLYGDSDGTDVTLFESNQLPDQPQIIPFKFVVKGTSSLVGKKFLIKSEFFDSDDVNVNNQEDHYSAWGNYGCTPDDENNDKFCSSHGVNEFSSLDSTNFFITHDHPEQVTTTPQSVITAGDFNSQYQSYLGELSPSQAETFTTNHISQYWPTSSPNGSAFSFEYDNNSFYPGLNINIAGLSAGPHFMYQGCQLQGGVEYTLNVDFGLFVEWYIGGGSVGSFVVRLQCFSVSPSASIPDLEFEDSIHTFVDIPSQTSNWDDQPSISKSFTPAEDVYVYIQMGFILNTSVNNSTPANAQITNISLTPAGINYEDHSQQQEGEDVNILHLKAVKGNITNAAPNPWDGDTSVLTVENSATYEDHFSVIGLLQVNSFGDYNNNYVIDLSKIVEWRTTGG